ncbi:MAG: O-acetylserine/cysteine exporter [Candidatus Elarobacter sp.]
MSHARSLALLFLTVVVWGYNWIPLKITALEIDPWWLSAWRVGGGAIVLFAALALSRRSMAPPPGSKFIAVGIAQVAGLVAFSTLALRVGGVANVTALTFTMPLFTAIFAFCIVRERLSKQRVFWLAIAECGIAIVASGIRTPGEILGGIFATLGGASWALGNVLQRRAAYTIDLLRLVAWQQLVAAGPLFALALIFGRPVAHFDPGTVSALLFIAIVGSGLAWLWWGNALSVLPANTVALASFAIPVIAVVAARLQLGAVPAPTTVVGLAVVVAGLSGSVLAARASTDGRASTRPLLTTQAACERSA